MNKRISIIIILLIILAFLLFIFFSRSAEPNAPTTKATTSVADQNVGAQVMISGWLRCLPRKMSGVECTIGLEDTKGLDYGLLDKLGQTLDPASFTSGSSYSAAGTYVATPAALQNYNIQGTIQLNQ